MRERGGRKGKKKESSHLYALYAHVSGIGRKKNRGESVSRFLCPTTGGGGKKEKGGKKNECFYLRCFEMGMPRRKEGKRKKKKTMRGSAVLWLKRVGEPQTTMRGEKKKKKRKST